MGLFGTKENSEPKTETATAPEEEESGAEESYIEGLSNNTEVEVAPKVEKEKPIPTKKEVEIREVPVCMSQSQIYNLIIENNIILKQIISVMDS